MRRTAFSFLGFGAGILGAGLLTLSPVQALTPTEVTSAYTTSGVSGATDLFTNGSSYGFFFDVKQAGYGLNALGFSAQTGWLTSGRSYTVELWSYSNGQTSPVYSSLGSLVFNPANAGSYVLKDGYYWQSLPSTVRLNKTDLDLNTGYVIGTYGDFRTGGTLIEAGGTSTFNTGLFTNDGNGYNVATFGDYPVPAFDAGIGTAGYWNANLSTFEVPGPLPIFGAAAAFGWSRKMRRRISAAS